MVVWCLVCVVLVCCVVQVCVGVQLSGCVFRLETPFSLLTCVCKIPHALRGLKGYLRCCAAVAVLVYAALSVGVLFLWVRVLVRSACSSS